MEIVRKREGGRTRIMLFDGDERLSGLSLVHLRMRLGSSVVRVGGIAGVGTPHHRRGKGYARIVMEDSNELMASRGWEMGLLYGIRDFYPKFGYAVVMAGKSLKMTTRDAERAKLRHRARKMKASDKGALLRIYRRNNRSRTGSRLRDERTWDPGRKGSRWRSGTVVKVLTGKGGRIDGYVIFDRNNDETIVAELAGLSRECFESIIAVAARDAVDKRCGELVIFAPMDHPVFEVASPFGVRASVYRPRCGGAMGRVIDQEKLFAALSPELTRRLDGGALSKWRGTVAVETELGESLLAVRPGEVRPLRRRRKAQVRLELPQPRLAQLVMGYRSVADVSSEPEVDIRGKGAGELLEALFPKHEAYMWMPDHF